MLTAAGEAGYQVAMVTLTVRHRRGQSLRRVWDAVGAGWRRVTSGKGWRSDQRRYRVQGWARAVEVTHGAHGWHVHVHAVAVYDGDDFAAHALGASMWSRWSAGIERAGFDAVAGSGGLDVARAPQCGVGSLDSHGAERCGSGIGRGRCRVPHLQDLATSGISRRTRW